MKTDALVWVEPDGTAFPLTGQDDLDVHWALGVEGRFMPPITLSEDVVFDQPGTRVRNVQVGPRDVTLPITVIGADETAVRQRIRALLRSFDPTRGEGRLRATAPDGVMREVVCRYTDGLEGKEGRDDFGQQFQRLVLVLHASDPYWRDADPTEQTYSTGTPKAFLGDPFLGGDGMVTADTIIGSQTIQNDGDLPAYPVFTVAGPASSFTLTNNTTGERIRYEAAVAAGEVLVIDTRPFRKSVLRSDGTNLYVNLSLDSTLWALVRGPNAVTLDLLNSTTATYVTVSYQRTWLGP